MLTIVFLYRLNGDLVLHSDSVMYRNAVKSSGHSAAFTSDSDLESSTADQPDPATSSADSATSTAAITSESLEASTTSAGSDLVGDVAQGILGGLVRRDAGPGKRYIGSVETRPRIGLVELPFNKAPRLLESSSASQLASTIVPVIAQTQTRPIQKASQMTMTTSSVSNANVLYIVPDSAAIQHPLAGPSLEQLATKTNSKPVTFLGIMFGALSIFTFI